MSLSVGGGSSNYKKYSASEKVVGEWLDGKTIYEKTFSFGALTDSSIFINTPFISVGALVDNFVLVTGILYDSKGWCTAIPYVSYTGGTNYYIMPSLKTNAAESDKNSVAILYAGAVSWVKRSYLTVQYTKIS